MKYTLILILLLYSNHLLSQIVLDAAEEFILYKDSIVTINCEGEKINAFNVSIGRNYYSYILPDSLDDGRYYVFYNKLDFLNRH